VSRPDIQHSPPDASDQASAPLRVLVYEPNHTGHHYPYLARMLPALTDLPVQIVLATTREGRDSQEFASTLAPFQDRIQIDVSCTPSPRGALPSARHRLRELIGAVRRVRPDHVYVMYADGLWQPLQAMWLLGCRPLPGGVRIEGWLYRGGFTYADASGPANSLRRLLFSRMVRRGAFAALHLDDELMHEFALRHAPASAGSTGPRLVLTPNPIRIGPVTTRDDARRRLGLPTDGRLIVSSGMITRWKGNDLLLRAFTAMVAQPGHDDDQLLLAGPHEPAVRAMLETDPFADLVGRGRILSLDRFLSTDEMYLCAAAGDLTVAAYPNHSGRSSIILWSAAAGRPSLGTDRGCIGHVIRTQRLGLTCDVRNHDAFADALDRALNIPWTADDARRVREYASGHSIGAYQRSAAALIRQRLGLNETPENQADDEQPAIAECEDR